MEFVLQFLNVHFFTIYFLEKDYFFSMFFSTLKLYHYAQHNSHEHNIAKLRINNVTNKEKLIKNIYPYTYHS